MKYMKPQYVVIVIAIVGIAVWAIARKMNRKKTAKAPGKVEDNTTQTEADIAQGSDLNQAANLMATRSVETPYGMLIN